MRTLEIRRHTHRNVPQPHLSQTGVDLARRAGEGLGQFDRVVTSTVPRAFETAIAMGYAVDEQIEQLSMMSDEVAAVIQWNAGFAAWAKAAHKQPGGSAVHASAGRVVALDRARPARAWPRFDHQPRRHRRSERHRLSAGRHAPRRLTRPAATVKARA